MSEQSLDKLLADYDALEKEATALYSKLSAEGRPLPQIPISTTFRGSFETTGHLDSTGVLLALRDWVSELKGIEDYYAKKEGRKPASTGNTRPTVSGTASATPSASQPTTAPVIAINWTEKAIAAGVTAPATPGASKTVTPPGVTPEAWGKMSYTEKAIAMKASSKNPKP